MFCPVCAACYDAITRPAAVFFSFEHGFTLRNISRSCISKSSGFFSESQFSVGLMALLCGAHMTSLELKCTYAYKCPSINLSCLSTYLAVWLAG